MFHFAEYFVRKSIRNGILLLLIAAILMYLSSDSVINNVSIFVFLFVAVSWTGATPRVETSPDGITWTGRTAAAGNLWQSVT